MTAHFSERPPRPSAIMPAAIAHNDVLTAKERIELLQKMKAETVSGADSGFTLGDIDDAIEDVRLEAQSGRTSPGHKHGAH